MIQKTNFWGKNIKYKFTALVQKIPKVQIARDYTGEMPVCDI